MPIERVIGIDFGTSTSVIKVKTYKDNQPLVSKNAVEYVHFDNKDTLPTLVYRTDEGKFLIGYNAQDAAVKGTLYQNFKMNLISHDDVLRDEAVTYTEIFFKYMFQTYDEQRSHFASCDTETTYVSYPAKWPGELRGLMINIAERAGFKNVRGLDEPTAAIHTVMVQESEKLVLGARDTADILMIDMGAGTTDLVLCRYSPYEERHIKVLNTWPKSDSNCLFGGREVDKALCGYLEAYLIDCGLPNTKSFSEKYLDKCKVWKEANLSPILKEPEGVVKYCGFVDTLLAMMDIEKDFPPITRSDFENMMGGYISQFPRLIDDCLKDIGYDGGQLDYLILTGGHSQWYFTNEILEGTLTRFGVPYLPKIISDSKRIIKLSRPQETVALGLVFQRLNYERVSSKQSDERIYVKPVEEKVCLRCGKTIPIAAAFCTYCGNRDMGYSGAARQPGPQVKPPPVQPEIFCTNCGKKIPANALFCTYCGSRNNRGGAVIQKEPVQPRIFCTNCGRQIPANSTFCMYCRSAVGNPGTVVQPSITIRRESQAICAGVSYKVVVNGTDYGNIAPGQSKVVKSSTTIADIEIICTTAMMANIKLRMKLRLSNDTRVHFTLQYNGAIIPSVQGAEVLETST